MGAIGADEEDITNCVEGVNVQLGVPSLSEVALLSKFALNIVQKLFVFGVEAVSGLVFQDEAFLMVLKLCLLGLLWLLRGLVARGYFVLALHRLGLLSLGAIGMSPVFVCDALLENLFGSFLLVFDCIAPVDVFILPEYVSFRAL